MVTMKAFLIESDESYRVEFGNILVNIGWEFQSVSAVDDSLDQAITTYQPDLIIVEAGLIAKITASLYKNVAVALHKYPVVFSVDPRIKKISSRLKNLNACGWIVKPINPPLLEATLGIALEKFTAARQVTERCTWYLEILEHIQDVCWITDLSGVIEDVSPSVKNFFNFSREELIGHNIADYSGLAMENEKIWSTLKSEGYLNDYRITVRNKANKLIGCRLTAEIIPGQNKVFGILKNIRGSQDTEQQLGRILEGAAVPIFVINSQHIITHWNKAIENLTGLPAEQVIGSKGAWQAFYTQERPLLADLVLDDASLSEIRKYYPENIRRSQLIPDAYESVCFFEKIGSRKNLWLFITAARIRNEKGRVNGAIETLHDISESVRTDRALKESELKFHSFFDQSSDGLILIDHNGAVVEWNRTLEKLSGIKRSEVIGVIFNEFIETLPKTTWGNVSILDNLVEVVEYFLKSRETMINNRFVEGEVHLNSGQKKYLRANIAPIHTGDNIMVAVNIHDLTQYKQMESTRQNIEEQLRQQKRLESIGTLASGVAHEVNNPLTGIINYAQLIHDRVTESSLQEFAQGIIEEGERVAGIVRNLLAFARHDKEGHSPARMSDIVRVSLALIETVIRKDMITIKVDVSDDLPMVQCKSQQIEQVIINLLMNARDALNMKYDDYNEEKLIEIKSYVIKQTGSCWLTTEITDHGIGIPADVAGSIFDPFFTTKSRSEGTGLGLSVSYGIIKEHGGEIKVDSVAGKYTKFSFTLPVEDITVR